MEQTQIIVNIFGLDDARLDAIDREVVTYLMKHVMEKHDRELRVRNY